MRPFWLDALYHAACRGGRFWIRGSILSGPDLDRNVLKKLSSAGLRHRANGMDGNVSLRSPMPMSEHVWEPHINGAAFYSLRDPAFTQLVIESFEWVEADHRRRASLVKSALEFSFDAAIYVTFNDLIRTDFARYRRNVHRMQYTAVVRNLGFEESTSLDPLTPYSLLRLQTEYPETFVVHARNRGLAPEARRLPSKSVMTSSAIPRGSHWNISCPTT